MVRLHTRRPALARARLAPGVKAASADPVQHPPEEGPQPAHHTERPGLV